MANQVPMVADSGTVSPTAEEVKLAPGVGENIPQAAPEDLYGKAFDPQGYAASPPGSEPYPTIESETAAKLAALNNPTENGGQVQSLMNASSPTPLGGNVNPSVASTLSNVGKIEPGQLAADGAAMPQAVGGTKPANADAIQAPQAATPAAADPFAESQKTLTAGYEAQVKANNSIASAQRAKGVADQAAFKDAEAAYVKAEAERAVTKAKFDTDYAGKMQSYEKSIEDYKQAAGEKVIPGQLLANMDTGSRIQSGIFMALSAYGSAMSGQENQALKVINNAINQDIDAQKFNIDNKLKGARMGVEGSQYMMTQMREKFKDDESATLATRAAMLAMTQQKLNISASKFDQQTAGPKYAALNAQLTQQYASTMQDLKLKQSQAFLMDAVSKGGESTRNLNASQLALIPDKTTRESYVPGYGVGTSGAEGAKELQKVRAEAEPAINGIKRVLDLTADYNRITDVAKKQEIKSEVASLTSSLQPLLIGSKRLSELGIDQITKAIGDPTALLTMPDIQRHKMTTVNNKIISDLNNSAKQYGYTPIYSTQQLDSKLYSKPKK